MSTLIYRCRDFFAGFVGKHFTSDDVMDLADFVLSEVGRAADPALKDTVPLVLYFTTEQDREEMVAAIMQEKPGMISKRWPR